MCIEYCIICKTKHFTITKNCFNDDEKDKVNEKIIDNIKFFEYDINEIEDFTICMKQINIICKKCRQ